MDISPIDLINIQRFSARLVGLTRYRRELSEYLGTKMTNVAPSLTSLVGEQVRDCTCAIYCADIAPAYHVSLWQRIVYVNKKLSVFCNV